MRRLLRFAGIVAAVVVGLGVLGGGLLAFEIRSRKPLKTIPSTTHASITRQECIDCHAPIAAEWRQSFHYRSLTGPYWKDVREMGFLKVFNATSKACINRHAPANVLDLAETVPAAASGDEPLGVECTPNLLREPRGTISAAGADDVELGVDCTSCHVSRRGIVGAGRHLLKEKLEVFDKDEAMLLDSWPFRPPDKRIGSGEQREILLPLPEGHGTVEAVVRYHDWMRMKRTIRTLKAKYG
jgi:hypothetical protein